MKIWYQCKAKYGKENEEGIVKQTSELHLVDAVSYTDAESRIYGAMERTVSGEFQIMTISKTNIGEVINFEDADYWYKCKVQYSTVDGDSEKEVKITTYILTSAESVKDAYEKVEQSLDNMLVPFEISSIAKTNIVEVFPEMDEEEIPANLTPLADTQDEVLEEDEEELVD
ncbi:MAG: DUF4494 domain-containing protein [Reichenbachiella sp.]|uniref:DUF4494 domain-containing protein n=1 Tax=Reichenbachiella sp. TaxID=2184521 RepID=UPI0032991C07